MLKLFPSHDLAAGDVIDFVQILGNVLDIGQPSDDTVTAAKLNNDVISGQTALTSAPASTDELLISDAGTIKRIDVSLIGETNTPYFQAYRGSSEQTLGSGSWTKIQINTEVVDSANAFDNSTNYRFTPQTAGKYFIYGQMTSSTGTDMARCMAGIYLNGSAVSQTNSFNDDSSSAHTATIVDLNGSSDYVELYGYLGSGGNTDLQNRATFFGGFLISGT